jgi:hypothetical protein
MVRKVKKPMKLEANIIKFDYCMEVKDSKLEKYCITQDSQFLFRFRILHQLPFSVKKHQKTKLYGCKSASESQG